MKRLWICALLLLSLCLCATGVAAEETETEAETAATAKLIAITFDDGPGPYTSRLLDGLAARDAKATFFIVGNRVGSYTALVQREVREGHQIANHSWNHAQLTTLGASGVRSQINDTAAALRKASGQSGGFYLRPPYGSYNSTVKANAGGPVILWSVDTLDWKYRNSTTVKNNILKGARDGAIVLLHDIHSTSVTGALAAIDVLKQQGYQCVTVQELFRRRGVTPQSGAVYSNVPANGVDIGAPVDDGADYDETKLDQHWAWPAIQFVQEKGLMSGTSSGKFSPDKYLTRGMVVTVLARFDGVDLTGYKADFSDVKQGAWYDAAIGWAAQHGVVNGVDGGRFAPEDFITREQLCTILARYADYAGIALTPTVAAVTFADADKIHSFAGEAVATMQQAGLMNGVDATHFAPDGRASRAQGATVFQRLWQTRDATTAEI